MPWRFLPDARIPAVVLVEPHVAEDGRGFFVESFKESEFARAGLPTRFVQDGHTRNVGRGILRGLHFQTPPAAQGKLVRCTQGACFDVAVDLRRGSPTFGGHVAAELSSENKRMLWIPEGFAHGYVTLSDACEIQYKFSGHEYSAPHARALRWDDARLAIPWPIARPTLLARDATAPTLDELEASF